MDDILKFKFFIRLALLSFLCRNRSQFWFFVFNIFIPRVWSGFLRKFSFLWYSVWRIHSFFFFFVSIGQAFSDSQLSRKRPSLVHEKVVAYERWSLARKINKISPKLYRSTNNNDDTKLLLSLVKNKQIGKAVAFKLIYSGFCNTFCVL